MVIAVLWVTATALASSNDDAGLAAATDGTDVWITRNGGVSWERTPSGADLPEDPGEADDSSSAEDPTFVQALAFRGADLLIATTGGLWAYDVTRRRKIRESPRSFETLTASTGGTWGTSGRELWHGVNRGTWIRASRVPSPGIRALAARNEEVIVATDHALHRWRDGAWWNESVPGTVALAVDHDRALLRGTRRGVERYEPTGWRTILWHPPRALATGRAEVWVAIDQRVVRLDELSWAGTREEIERPSDPYFEPSRASSWAGMVPSLSVMVQLARGEHGSRTEFFVVLGWSMGSPLPAAEEIP